MRAGERKGTRTGTRPTKPPQVLPGNPQSPMLITTLTLQPTDGAQKTNAPVTFGLPLNQGVYGPDDYLGAKLDGIDVALQTDIKATWDTDGSPRHVILSLVAGTVLAGDSALEIWRNDGGRATGAGVGKTDSGLTAAIGTTTFTCSRGSTNLANLLAGAPKFEDNWLSGSVCTEWIVAEEIENDLAAWWHVRYYPSAAAGYKIWVRFVLEEGWADTLKGTSTYTALGLTVAGSSKWTKASLTHYDLSRWTLSYWDTNPLVHPRIAADYLYATTHCFPRHYSISSGGVAPTEAELNALPFCSNNSEEAQEELIDNWPKNGEFENCLNAGGYGNQIGVEPKWVVVYLASNSDIRAWRWMIRQSQGAGVYSAHRRDETTGYPLDPADNSTYYTQTNGNAPRAAWDQIHDPGMYASPCPGSPCPASHQPNFAFAAYLVTGDRYFLDEQVFWLLHCWAWHPPQHGAQNLLRAVDVQSPRDIAWYMNVGITTHAFMPASYPGRTSWKSSLDAQMAFWLPKVSSTGLLEGKQLGTTGTGQLQVWMNDFMIAVMTRITLDLGYTGSNYTALRDLLYQAVVNRLGGVGADYCWACSSSYSHKVGLDNNWSNAYTDWGNIYTESIAVGRLDPACPTSCSETGNRLGGNAQMPDSYWGQTITAAAYAADANAAGARDAFQRLKRSLEDEPFTEVANDNDWCQNNNIWEIVPKRYPWDTYGDNALSDAAASLSPGQSLKFATSGLFDCFYVLSELREYLQWGNTGVWSPITKKAHWIGKREGADQRYRHGEYDAETNVWTRTDNLPGALTTGQAGHGYDHNALDPITGDLYFRSFGTSPVFHKWTRATNTWSTIPQSPTVGSDCVAEAIEWWNGRGLIHSCLRGVSLWNGSSWSTLVTSGELSGIGYHTLGEYQPTADVYVFGGGNNGPTKLYRLDSNDVLTTLGPAPIGLGNSQNPGQGILVHDPASNEYIAWDQANSWYKFDAVTDTWTGLTQSTGNGSSPQNGTPNMSLYSSIAIPISDYGVIMFIGLTTSAGSDECWLYKHS